VLDLPDDRTAVDILEIVVAISSAWTTVPQGLRAIGGEDPQERQAAHRAVVVAAVSAICRAMSGKEAAAGPTR
jgi:hypothetical protein